MSPANNTFLQYSRSCWRGGGARWRPGAPTLGSWLSGKPHMEVVKQSMHITMNECRRPEANM